MNIPQVHFHQQGRHRRLRKEGNENAVRHEIDDGIDDSKYRLAAEPVHADNYYVSGYSTSYKLPSGWPNKVDIDSWSFDAEYYTDKIDAHTGTPVWICTAGIHYSWDGSNCGANNDTSSPYGIGDNAPAIGIGVAYGVCEALVNPCYPIPQAVQLAPGDDTCKEYSNHGSQVTKWWEYEISDPKAGLYTFSADVNFKGSNDGYYAVLTNCELTQSPPPSPSSR